MAEYFEDTYDEDFLPCEFCDELIPMTLLIEHQTACRPDLMSYHRDADPKIQPESKDKESNDFSFLKKNKETDLKMKNVISDQDNYFTLLKSENINDVSFSPIKNKLEIPSVKVPFECSEKEVEEDCILSDDDDDDIESLESFWKRAAIEYKKQKAIGKNYNLGGNKKYNCNSNTKFK